MFNNFREYFPAHRFFYLFILLLLFIFSNSLLAQSLKTYEGPYQMNGSFEGKAVYTYKEVDYNRLKHGKFTFTENVNRGRNNKIVGKTSGSYSNGELNGSWSHSLNGILNGVTTTCITTGVFKSGVPNGLFKYELKLQQGSEKVGVSCSVNYNMGIVAGAFSYKSYGIGAEESINGSFNSEGFVVGEFITKSGIYDDIFKADPTGKALLSLSRKDGEIIESFDVIEGLSDITENDIFYDTLDFELSFDALSKTVWSDNGFNYLNGEGKFNSNKLKEPRFIRSNRKGKLEDNNFYSYSDWKSILKEYTNIYNYSDFLKTSLKVDSIINVEQSNLSAIKDKLLSEEINFRDSVLEINNKVKRGLEEFVSLKAKLFEVLESLNFNNDKFLDSLNVEMKIIQDLKKTDFLIKPMNSFDLSNVLKEQVKVSRAKNLFLDSIYNYYNLNYENTSLQTAIDELNQSIIQIQNEVLPIVDVPTKEYVASISEGLIKYQDLNTKILDSVVNNRNDFIVRSIYSNFQKNYWDSDTYNPEKCIKGLADFSVYQVKAINLFEVISKYNALQDKIMKKQEESKQHGIVCSAYLKLSQSWLDARNTNFEVLENALEEFMVVQKKTMKIFENEATLKTKSKELKKEEDLGLIFNILKD